MTTGELSAFLTTPRLWRRTLPTLPPRLLRPRSPPRPEQAKVSCDGTQHPATLALPPLPPHHPTPIPRRRSVPAPVLPRRSGGLRNPRVSPRQEL
ncbi:hypothetical protein GUJ93_ZPchr0007g6101 [Zizania palustris]|uniref:Uncharacterized protein n=1 Tax=Zizania palustris TaxID=103762 RepID=A0A8J5W5I0_ZIZPA|nr:hypothetical protein GUJ93_ZPchr0007g6101 [Zizania palustris]